MENYTLNLTPEQLESLYYLLKNNLDQDTQLDNTDMEVFDKVFDLVENADII